MTHHRSLHTEAAPAAVGPYSQAVELDLGERKLLFLAGQIPLDPASGELVTGDIQAQTRRVMENLEAVLTAAGSGFDRVVRTTIFLADMGDFAAVNEVYAGYFGEAPPARATVQAAGLPKGVEVEIDAIAYV